MRASSSAKAGRAGSDEIGVGEGAHPATTRQTATAGDVLRVASGNLLEMYDFMIFGYFAEAIGRAYFPADDEVGALLKSLATFGVGFLMRPLGAVVLGSYTDRHGRRAGLLLTLSLMSVGIIILTLTPGYVAIGLAAPFLVLVGRLVQGFSAGAELGNVSVYLAEMAPPDAKGFFVSWQSASQQVAVMLAAAIGFALASLLTPEQILDWGWRVPLGIGCLIVPVIFLLRRGLREVHGFATQVRPQRTTGAILRDLWGSSGRVMIGMALVLMTTVSFYMITAYTPTFGKALHLTSRDSLIVTACVGLSNLLWLPLMGAFSDRIGRKPILVTCTLLAIATAYPAMSWLAASPSMTKLLLVELWLSFLYASYNGAMVVYLTEVVPAHVRASGFSLAYSLATAVGGFTPFMATWLIKETGNVAIPGAWLSGAAAISLIAALSSTPAGVRSNEGAMGVRAPIPS
ncbi:MFS transporter [Sphingomonas crusticola]|uniref:MFS transporter n=1 Tax=Sphingomonas crusticola TaxID=1697973 RepID=UPI000E21E5FB|nr:MFS transporter [Sphingomonas crusticola]